jgi:hypothetical protein
VTITTGTWGYISHESTTHCWVNHGEKLDGLPITRRLCDGSWCDAEADGALGAIVPDFSAHVCPNCLSLAEKAALPTLARLRRQLTDEKASAARLRAALDRWNRPARAARG